MIDTHFDVNDDQMLNIHEMHIPVHTRDGYVDYEAEGERLAEYLFEKMGADTIRGFMQRVANHEVQWPLDEHPYTDSNGIISCPRETAYSKCSCGKKVMKVAATKKEINSPLNCPRGYACCIGVFECGPCQTRQVVSLQAPSRDD